MAVNITRNNVNEPELCPEEKNWTKSNSGWRIQWLQNVKPVPTDKSISKIKSVRKQHGISDFMYQYKDKFTLSCVRDTDKKLSPSDSICNRIFFWCNRLCNKEPVFAWFNRPIAYYTSEPISQPSRPIHLHVHIEFDPRMVGKSVLVCYITSLCKWSISSTCTFRFLFFLFYLSKKKKNHTFRSPETQTESKSGKIQMKINSLQKGQKILDKYNLHLFVMC